MTESSRGLTIESNTWYEMMVTIEDGNERIRQAERNTNLASLLYVTRTLGRLEGITDSLGIPDQRIVSTRDDLRSVYHRLMEKVGLTEYMDQQQRDLDINTLGSDY